MKKGDKVRMKDGQIRPKGKLKSRMVGVIVGRTRSGTLLYVKWEGITEPDLLSPNHLEVIDK